MRRRFRKVVKDGWHVVQINRKNLWNWANLNNISNTEDFGDAAHYRHIRSWCAKTFDKDSWEGRFISSNFWKDTGGEIVTKEFAFKNLEDQTLFALKWQ